MKKIYVLFALSVCNQLAAQNNFQKIGPPPPAIQIIDELEGLNGTAQGSADIDNDGDVDLLFTGQNPAGALKANLYVNNGLGGYTLNTSTPFVGVFDGALAFFDADDDGDQDVIITGQDFSSYTAKLYLNDGSGNFTQSSNFFTGVGYSAVSIADVDNDTDIDVLICGQANSGVKADLYLNDGVGNFTFNALASSTFTGVYLGTSEFGDIDSDGDQDLVLMGYGDNGTVSGMYTNNGSGVFTSVPTVFPPLNGCDIVFTDADGDSFSDVIITGSDPVIGATTKFYHNNGSGVFTLDVVNTLEILSNSYAAIDDVDSDGDEDLIMTGSTQGFGNQTFLYLNDGNAIYTEVAGTPFSGVANGRVSLDDVDGDSDNDLIISGSAMAKLYQNIGNGIFEAITTSPFMGLSYGAVELADVDNDGDLDAYMNGQGAAGFHSKLYLNDGNGGYTLDPANNFFGAANAAADFADVDNDGDVDLMVSGYNNGQFVKLYTNDGNGLFTEVTTTNFPPVSSGAIQFNDVDSDGDQDVFISGFTIFVGNVGQLWMNDGTGNFTLSTTNTFEGANNGNIALADIDGDADDDVLMTGYGDLGRIAKLYTNDGTGTFTLVASPFPGVQQGAIAFGDVDLDQDMDLVIAGEIGSTTYTAEMYTNDGTGTFTLVAGTPFLPTISSGLVFVDVDNDLDPDLMTIGYNNTGSNTIANLYSNDGSGNFSLVTGTPFVAASYGMMTFGDIDGDVDLDVIICGNDGISGLQSNVYRNNNCQQANNIQEVFACGPYTWIDGNTYSQNTISATMLYPMPNSAGCDSVAVLHLTIGDAIATPSVLNLPNVTAECEITSLTAPTALFNCSGSIAGTTTQTFPISLQDTTEVVWTYTSSNGLEITQTQLVIIHDVTAPIATGTLPTITTDCPIYSVSTIPTATDNCGGIIEGTTTDLPAYTPGTSTITWTFVDASGNSSIQTQTVVFTPMNDTITFDGVTLTALEANQSYQWYDCNSENAIPGATNQTFTPTMDGSYSVSISNGNCEISSNCYDIVNLSVAQNEASLFMLYPNPTTGLLTIETQAELKLNITNAAGQKMLAENLKVGQTAIDLSGLAAGIYYATTTTSNGLQKTEKITLVK